MPRAAVPEEFRLAKREDKRRERARNPQLDRAYNHSLNGHARWLRYYDRKALARLEDQVKEAGIAL